jgi:hypothetical protein
MPSQSASFPNHGLSSSALDDIAPIERAALLVEHLYQLRKELRWVAREMGALGLCAFSVIKTAMEHENAADLAVAHGAAFHDV